MITGIILSLLFGSAVLSGTFYWRRDHEIGSIIWRAKRQIHYKNVKVREVEHVSKKLELESQRRETMDEIEKRSAKALEYQENRAKTDPEHLEWDAQFAEITREEDEAKAEAERLEKLAVWKVAEDKRLKAFIARQAEENRQNVETLRIEEANNLNNQFNGQAVTYAKVIYARVNVRMQPLTTSQVMFQIEPYQRAPIMGWVYGENYNGHNIWYKLAGTNGYAHGSAFEQANGVLPDLNEYEDTHTLRSFDGTVNRTVKGPPSNPWNVNPPKAPALVDGGITANRFSANIFTADKLYVGPSGGHSGVDPVVAAVGLRAPKEIDYKVFMDAFDSTEKGILNAFSALPLDNPTAETVDKMNSLADMMEDLRAERDARQVEAAHSQMLKSNEDALAILDSIFS